MKHYKSVEFLSNLNVKPLLRKCKAPRTIVKPPYWRLSGDGSGTTNWPTWNHAARWSKTFHNDASTYWRKKSFPL